MPANSSVEPVVTGGNKSYALRSADHDVGPASILSFGVVLPAMKIAAISGAGLVDERATAD